MPFPKTPDHLIVAGVQKQVFFRFGSCQSPRSNLASYLSSHICHVHHLGLSTCTSLTRVEARSELGFPPVPSLEASLTSIFGAKTNRPAGQRPFPPTKHHPLSMGFPNCLHQGACQLAAANNNITLLAYDPSKTVEELDLPAEMKSQVCSSADVILNLCAASAVCSFLCSTLLIG